MTRSRLDPPLSGLPPFKLVQMTLPVGGTVQRYLWQQADGKRHVYDTNDQYPARVGQPLTVLCGDTVTVRVKDMQPGMWLDPTCRACAVELASVLGWSEDEIAQMVARWDEATK
ncbi:hypothetical protein SacglDRAFT_01324 [Saccharomonospora glauca K62]|jgi:hypothetical protein|uniref:Uncharacterized protein n=2 Tax=Saccharomonospora glauca TaxID=40990 RepID=I1CZX6_9PSEU|nr:hypothetical protein SacglDRAFT_01324 [Saccharomonospora glauca K62]